MIYTVTAEDGVTTQDWTVTVVDAPNIETDILTFTFPEETGSAVIDAINHTVDVEVNYGTDLSMLTPTISVSFGGSIVPSSASQNDFTNLAIYTVTAEDGVTTQDWTVTVVDAPNIETDILTFTLGEQLQTATIDDVNHTVVIEISVS